MTIGKSADRLDGTLKVKGAARYAADHKPTRLLYVAALRSPIAHGRIASVCVGRARDVPGVVDIFTHKDAERLGWTSTAELDALSAEGLGRTALADAASKLPAYRPLIDNNIQFAGQWVAVVAAESMEAAGEGLANIDIEYMATDPAPTDRLLPGPFFGADMQHARGADPDADESAVRTKALYETPMQLHQPLEPSATTAHWQDGCVTLHDSTQGVLASRDYVACSLGVPVDAVRVVAPFVGGGFGAKNQIWPHQALAAHISRALGRPVRMQLSRSDMAVASGFRSDTEQAVELAADAEGRLLELHHHSNMPTSLRGGFFEPCGLNSLMLYNAARVSVSHHVTRKAIATPTPFRGPGETPGSFALESALDELAYQLRIDPLELRKRNFAERDFYHDRPWSLNNLLRCYGVGAQRFGWLSGPVVPASVSRGGLSVGQGMATTAYPAPALPASVRIVLNVEGTLLVETSATDIGTGMRTVLAQTVSEKTGVEVNRIDVEIGDSLLPHAPTAGRSKSAASVLPAAANACSALLEILNALDPFGRSQPNATSLFDQLARAGKSQIEAIGHAHGSSSSRNVSHYSFGAHFVEVEYDALIHKLRVSRVTSVFDCGRIVNPKLAESQVRGGIVFGIGMALMEDGKRHHQTLRPLADNLADYTVPVHADMPQIDVSFIDEPDPSINELGIRGLGEIGLPGIAAAIANAFFHATGHRVRRLPIDLRRLANVGNTNVSY